MKMKNKLINLNNHLFAQLERLSDEDLKGEELASEMNRAKAITGVAKEIVANGKLALDAQKAVTERYVEGQSLPKMLREESK